MVQSFDVESPFVDFVDFASNDRVVFGRLQDKKLQVFDIKSGDKVCDVSLAKEAEKDASAISPGRGYLALVSWHGGGLRVYDLSDGQLVGEAPTPKKNGQDVRCFGLSFSPDGSELAGLFEYFGEHRIVCWNVADGKMLADFNLGKEIQRPTFYASRGIEWFPNKSALLVLGYAIVDRSSGKMVWTLPFDNQNRKVSPRRFLDNEHALVVTSEPSMTLRTDSIPLDKIAGAVAIVRSGGNAADAALPPLQPGDYSGAKTVDLRGKAGAWSLTPKVLAPSSRRLTARPLALKGKPDEMRALLFPGGDSTQVVVVGTPQQPGQPNPTEGELRWVERFDLAGGKNLGKVDLPNVVDPIAISPDGSLLLLREARAKDRLDVVSASDGKPVAGWRPYEKESPDAKGVAWAAFLDSNRVLSVNTGGTLVLWSLPKCKASYVAEDAFVGSPVLSPDWTLVGGFDGRSLRVLDAETGVLKGEGAAPTGLGQRALMKAAAFRPDGQELAVVFQNSNVVRWDLKTGKVASQFALTPPVPVTSLEWAGNGHVLLDNRLMVDLDSKRIVWEYVGGQVGGVGPDGRHWLVVRGIPGQESGRLASIDSPDPSVEKAEALLADARSPAILRPGFRVSLQLNLGGPPKDAPAYRQALADAIGAKLKQNGLTVVEDGAPVNRPSPVRVSYIPSATLGAFAGPDARLVVNAREKDTGQTIQYRRMGQGLRNIQVVKLIDLVCEMSLVDASGSVTWMPPQTIPMQPFGFVLRMPAGENDPEIYLKKLQWDKVKAWATTAGPPYFVARDGNEVVRLPGWTDLNAEFAR
jgi:WD40 repeat protein